jgi:hypothetical protein
MSIPLKECCAAGLTEHDAGRAKHLRAKHLSLCRVPDKRLYFGNLMDLLGRFDIAAMCR